MQCPACRAVYSNGLELCPRCKTPALNSSTSENSAPEASAPTVASQTQGAQAITSNQNNTNQTGAGVSSTAAHSDASGKAAHAGVKPPASTLIEFPGAGRAARPQWRRDLSERVREIQERRARDAAREEHQRAVEAQSAQRYELPINLSPEDASPQLGLVPSSAEAIPVNPLVAAALRRVERARQSSPPSSANQTRGRASMGNAATAVARVAEEHYQPEAEWQASSHAQFPDTPPSVNAAETAMAAETPTTARAHSLVVVPAHSTTHEAKEQKPQPRLIVKEVIDDALLARLDAQQAGVVHTATFDAERAPFASRLAGGAIDFLVVAFASTPFAAIIELTNGNWTDLRVAASMTCIVALVMFLYLMASTALTGRTLGMSLVSLHAADVRTGLLPTTKQSVTRAIGYMLSLATCGIGLFYALMDAEGRTVHDHLSGTIVVRD